MNFSYLSFFLLGVCSYGLVDTIRYALYKKRVQGYRREKEEQLMAILKAASENGQIVIEKGEIKAKEGEIH